MRGFHILLFWFSSTVLFGQKFETDTIVYNGSSEERINLVYLSDGYTEGQLDQFYIDVLEFNGKLFSEPPFSNYIDYFNVFAIRVPSNEEGANHPGTATDVSEPRFPVADVDTYFNSEFDYLKIHRLLVARNSSAVNTVLAENFPMYDQAFVIVNSPHYGGSGGAIPVSSVDESAAEIVIHEIGHSFARLADEYYAGDIFANESANMTKEQDPSLVKWKNWNDTEGVGLYQHCCGGQSSSWYKPHESCKMRVLGAPFCAVCREAIIERVHTFVSPIVDYTPKEESLTPDSFPLTFDIITIDPIPNTLHNNWVLNNEVIATNQNTMEIESSMLLNDINRLVMTLEDTSEMLRINNHSSLHAEVLLWEIDNLTTGTIDVNSKKITFDIFPNPIAEIVSIETESNSSSDFEIRVSTVEGRQLISGVAGVLNTKLDINLSMLPKGVYIMNILLEDGVIYSEKLIVQ